MVLSVIRVLVLHGPNLNLLGSREPDIYGSFSLEELDEALAKRAQERGVDLRTMQSNHEGALIDALHDAGTGSADVVLLNAGGLTHLSLIHI